VGSVKSVASTHQCLFKHPTQVCACVLLLKQMIINLVTSNSTSVLTYNRRGQTLKWPSLRLRYLPLFGHPRGRICSFPFLASRCFHIPQFKAPCSIFKAIKVLMTSHYSDLDFCFPLALLGTLMTTMAPFR
jgi:hypothetical protein